ncbi:alkaline-phosphatase-like protein [Plectosphaerella plurivora]|uniref:Arylsulfatase n=1 Tax=Plectosphaerella plurivora TaxID=936078 RepID=A0A9P8VKB4_9PEZI|nr:alkaline-phosphatase-like protein [Plectosphaerella plurivora]
MKLSTLLIASSAAWPAAAASARPNILFILVDDQDWHMHSLDYMPSVQKHLVGEGTLYANHYCTVALCCPSRVNMWTGRAAHNTNVTDVFAPYGGYPKVVREGINENYLPTWLQDAGYNTYYSGKLWNQHDVTNYNKPFARGFNQSSFLLDPYTYQYRNATISHNGAPPVNYPGQYSPDITAEYAYVHLNDALSRQHDRPWFVVHAPIAPHSNVDFLPEFSIREPEYAERHAHLFKDYIIPRGDNFNVGGGVSWVKHLPPLNDTVIAYNDEFQRARLRALQSVDEMVESMIRKLKESGQLENTYIIYTTDNGYHISQHRMHPGKECGFDTDVHIPLIVRGPGIPAGHVSHAVTSHTDIASTILGLIGQQMSEDETDGTPIPLSLVDEAEARHEHVTIEYWGLAVPESKYGSYGDTHWTDDSVLVGAPGTGNNTYKAVRVISESYNFYYAVWCTNERELYDLKTDPGETKNLLAEETRPKQAYTLFGRPLSQVVARLDALTLVLKSCKGRVCVEPWRQLHPRGDVSSLKDSLSIAFDAFYEGQDKVSFSDCKLGYLPEFEGPMVVNQFEVVGGEDDTWPQELRKRDEARHGGRWSEWT